MRKSLLALVGLLVMPSLALAQGAAGKWMGEMQGRGGTQQLTLQLKVDGEHLMGTLQQGEQEAVEISDGKVDGNTIMFATTVAGRGGNTFTINYKGMVKGSEMTLEREFQGRGGGGGGGRGGGAPMPIMLKKM